MEKLIDLLTSEVSAAFERAGYEARFGRVAPSNRPDLCEYQCPEGNLRELTWDSKPDRGIATTRKALT